MGKRCNLCGGIARMYCESDQASLCWDCDGKVHGANFLVAKHTRCLLCSSCQSLTPWKATGLSFGQTFSVCDSCVALKNAARAFKPIPSEDRVQEVNSFDYGETDGAESYDDDEEEEEEEEEEDEEYSDDEDEEEEEEEEAENQVVPWSATAQTPPLMSTSSSDGGSGGFVTKRSRDFSDDEIGSTSTHGESKSSRPMKRSSINEPSFKSTAVVNSIVRLNGAADTSSSFTFAISKTRRDRSR